MPYTAAQTVEEVLPLYAGPSATGFERKLKRQKVRAAAAASFAVMDTPLPPRCKVLWSTLKTLTTVTYGTQTGVNGADATATVTSLADNFAIVLSTNSSNPLGTAATVTATQAGTSNFLLPASTGTAANFTVIHPGCDSITGTYHLNTGTAPLYVYVVPCITQTGSGTYNLNVKTASTAGYKFGAQTDIEVQVAYETLPNVFTPNV